MKFKRIIAGYSFDLTKPYDFIIPDNWSDKKLLKKFQRDNPDLKTFNIFSINESEAVSPNSLP